MHLLKQRDANGGWANVFQFHLRHCAAAARLNLKRKNLHTFIDPTIWSSRIRFKGYVASDICQNHSFSRAPIVFNPILPS